MDLGINYFFDEKNFKLIHDNCLNALKSFKDETFDMIFADPPYFLSNGGITCSNGKMTSVNKGEWDKALSLNSMYDFNYEWIKECKRILKSNGTIWISGTYHNIHSIGMILQQQEYKILNNITWYKRNAPPNLSCRYFTHSTETIIWAKKSDKSKHYFNYKLMKEFNGNKQMRDVWDIPCVKKSEKIYGKFPTQKPLELMNRIILSSTKEGDLILDPFNGSGTTGISASSLNRSYIGIDFEKMHLELSIKRYLGLISNDIHHK